MEHIPLGTVGFASAILPTDEEQRDALRRCLEIGMHWDVEVTGGAGSPGPLVSQAFCSALPVSYQRFCRARDANWAPLVPLVLEAAYEATLSAAAVNAQGGASRKVLLTLLGGGAFGNDERWILSASHATWRRQPAADRRSRPMPAASAPFCHPAMRCDMARGSLNSGDAVLLTLIDAMAAEPTVVLMADPEVRPLANFDPSQCAGVSASKREHLRAASAGLARHG